MKGATRVLVFLLVLVSLAAGCGKGNTSAPTLPTPIPQPAATLAPTAQAVVAPDSTLACPAADGQGTVSPAISIYSIVFVVNGVEQVVRDGDMLQARPGDEVLVREVTVCVGPFSGNGGQACVDLVPLTESGEEVVSEHRGTDTVTVTPGFVSIPWPYGGWTIDHDWSHFSAVLNHWPMEDTADADCASGRCERDDRMVIGLR